MKYVGRKSLSWVLLVLLLGQFSFVNVALAVTSYSFLKSSFYVRQNSSDLTSQIKVPTAATAVNFYLNGDESVAYPGYLATAQATYKEWRLKTPLAAGSYNITAKYFTDNWYDVDSFANIYSLDTPWFNYISPSDSAVYRPGDNPLRIEIDDQFEQFKNVTFELYNYNVTTKTRGSNISSFTVGRSDCDLREAGYRVICDANKATNWVPLAEGFYVSDVWSGDYAGGGLRVAYSGTDSKPFYVDATRPVTSSLSIENFAPVYTKSIIVSANAVDNVGIKNVEFYLTAPRSSDEACDGNGARLLDYLVKTSDLDGKYRQNIDSSSLTGDFCVNVVSEDASASHSNPIQSLKVEVDNLAPSVPEIVSPENFAIVNPTGLVLNWSDVTDDHGVNYFYRSYWNGGSYGPVSTGSVSEIDASGSGDNVYQWQAQACDNLNNCSDWTKPQTITIDRTIPSNPGTPIANVKSPTNQKNIVFNWSPSNAQISGLKSYEWTLLFNSVPTESGSTAATTLPVGLIYGDGNYQLKVKAIDNALNESTFVLSDNLILDTVAPVAPTPISLSDGASIKGVAFTQKWSKVSDAVEYKYESCNVDPGDIGSVCLNQKYVSNFTGTSKSVGAGQPNSHFWWRLKSRDAAGNWSNFGESYEMWIDNSSPVITLEGDNPQILEVHSEYKELGANAIDNYGNKPVISSSIVIDKSALNSDILGDYPVIYTVSDDAGNLATKTRVVKVVDTTVPVIELIGEVIQTVEKGSEYKELGANVVENYDEGIKLIIDSSTVDTNKLGVYSVTYNAKDSSGNDAEEVIRTVKVVDTTAPAVATSFIATAGNSVVNLTWINPSDPDFAGVNIYRSTTPGVFETKINSTVFVGAAYTDNDVVNGTNYFYQLKTVDQSSNESSNLESPVASATPVAPTVQNQNNRQQVVTPSSSINDQSVLGAQTGAPASQGGQISEEAPSVKGAETDNETLTKTSIWRKYWGWLTAIILLMLSTAFVIYKRQKS